MTATLEPGEEVPAGRAAKRKDQRAVAEHDHITALPDAEREAQVTVAGGHPVMHPGSARFGFHGDEFPQMPIGSKAQIHEDVPCLHRSLPRSFAA
jgi:hypothetical protein